MTGQFSHGYALLAGVGEARQARWSLPATVRDVGALRQILTDRDLCGYPGNPDHVRLLHDAGATRAAILDGLAWLRARAAADPQATAVVCFSGHGWLDRATDRYYLVPHDVDGEDVPGSALPAEAFAEAIGAIEAQRLLVFLDCCHAEAMAAPKDGAAPRDGAITQATPEAKSLTPLRLPEGFARAAAPPALAEALLEGEGRAVFSSSRGRQRAWIRPDGVMSVYTYHLVEALQGAGNGPGDTAVRVSNLMNYLGRAVPRSARRLCDAEQTPFFETAAEDFPIALLRGGKGLPAGGWGAVRGEARETMERLYRIVQAGPVAMARGRGARAASGRSVAADTIQGPVVTGDGSIAASGDVILAPGGDVQAGGIRAGRIEARNVVDGVQVLGGDAATAAGLVALAREIRRGGITAGQIRARNLVSGLQYIADPSQATVRDLQREVAALRQEVAGAIAAGEVAGEDDAEDARDALAAAEAALAAPEPRGNRAVRKLAEVADILTRSAEAAEALDRAGARVIKLAPVAATLWQIAQNLFGG